MTIRALYYSNKKVKPPSKTILMRVLWMAQFMKIS